jgi:hypothetical protein
MPRLRNYFQPTEFGRDKNPDWYGSAGLDSVQEKPGYHVEEVQQDKTKREPELEEGLCYIFRLHQQGSHREDGAACNLLNHQEHPSLHTTLCLHCLESSVPCLSPVLYRHTSHANHSLGTRLQVLCSELELVSVAVC